MNRRNFLGLSAATSAVAFTSLDAFASPITNPVSAAGFELIILATNWGFKGTIDEFCANSKQAGYNGIEVWWPGEDKSAELFAALKKYNLQVGFLCGGSSANPIEHFAAFKKAVIEATTNKIQQPLYINCHSGRDYFSYEDNKLFIDFTTQQAKTTSVPIYHETHRSRMLFAAHVAKNFIQKNAELRLTLDISHWCNVHESLLEDQEETVALALSKTEHIHARIGHSEGPQVNDPRAPEWQAAVQRHFEWWDKVIARKKKDGQRMTILTEFGPPHYLPALPYTQQPVADQWAINVYMLELLKKRYQ